MLFWIVSFTSYLRGIYPRHHYVIVRPRETLGRGSKTALQRYHWASSRFISSRVNDVQFIASVLFAVFGCATVVVYNSFINCCTLLQLPYYHDMQVRNVFKLQERRVLGLREAGVLSSIMMGTLYKSCSIAHGCLACSIYPIGPCRAPLPKTWTPMFSCSSKSSKCSLCDAR